MSHCETPVLGVAARREYVVAVVWYVGENVNWENEEARCFSLYVSSSVLVGMEPRLNEHRLRSAVNVLLAAALSHTAIVYQVRPYEKRTIGRRRPDGEIHPRRLTKSFARKHGASHALERERKTEPLFYIICLTTIRNMLFPNYFKLQTTTKPCDNRRRRPFDHIFLRSARGYLEHRAELVSNLCKFHICK